MSGTWVTAVTWDLICSLPQKTWDLTWTCDLRWSVAFHSSAMTSDISRVWLKVISFPTIKENNAHAATTDNNSNNSEPTCGRTAFCDSVCFSAATDYTWASNKAAKILETFVKVTGISIMHGLNPDGQSWKEILLRECKKTK